MTSTSTFVIIGGGLAGAKAAQALRDKGFDGNLVLVGDEQHLPYERPPLSKEFLAGKKTLNDFTVLDSAWYRDHDIDLRIGTAATAVDPKARTVVLPDDRTVRYDKLLLATGSRPRRPRIEGAEAPSAHYLRTFDDAAVLNRTLGEISSLAVVGGGWIGLEVAANARDRGVDVTVVEAARLPLLGALGPEAAAVFAGLHRDRGVDLRLESNVAAITARGLALDDGTEVDADAVLVAVGASPNIEIAEAAGLETGGGGVLVDASLRSSDPDVFAVGDIANAQHPLFGTRIRTEHWANALKQPVVAATNMLGAMTEYGELPYFFTDQYDLGMEYVGYAPRYTRVVFRGDVDGREFVVFWLDDDDRVLAGMNVNVWDVGDDVKGLIRSRSPVDADRLADPDTPLHELVTA